MFSTNLDRLSDVELLNILTKHFDKELLFDSYIKFSIKNKVDSGYDCFRTWAINYIKENRPISVLCYVKLEVLKKC